MNIGKGLDMLVIRSERGATHPVLLSDEERLWLVDTGVPGQAELIAEAVRGAGHAPEKLTGLIFTHQDMDHIGSARGIKALAPHMRVMAHAEEARYIDGTAIPIKMAARGPLTPEGAERIRAASIGIDARLSDGEVLPILGGLQVVHTPGHTPGHICLYVRESGVLIAGDGLNIANGRLTGPNPQYTFDMPLALSSVRRLAGMPISAVLTFHGGLFTGDVRAALLEIAQGR